MEVIDQEGNASELTVVSTLSILLRGTLREGGSEGKPVSLKEKQRTEQLTSDSVCCLFDLKHVLRN